VRSKPVKDLSASVRQRLLNLSQEKNADFNNLLKRYALERLMYRISRSPQASKFVLKGALLFEVWSKEPFRTTSDMDFLHLGSATIPELEAIFRQVCLDPVEEDGLVFLQNTVQAEEIREDNTYGGIRVQLLAMLGVARISLQIDVGLGDAVYPEPPDASFPTLLDQPAPQIAVYTRETAIAEKFEAMVVLGIRNSRMKDFFDIWVLMDRFPFDGEILAHAIGATFRRRGTAIPDPPPLALTPEFSRDDQKVKQWGAFIKKERRLASAPPFPEAINMIALFLMPPYLANRKGESFPWLWPPKGPWTPK
jgi:hypothetical protein